MIEDDRRQAMLLELERDGGSVESRAPEQVPPPAAAATTPPDMELDPRVRRGSLGPPPAAAPLGQAASSAALQAHLVHLLKPEPQLMKPDVQRALSLIQLAEPAEQRITPHEDPERQPDGVPHVVIGLTALSSVLFAAVLISVVRSGPSFGSILVGILVAIAVPVLVLRLGAKAERDRDHVHPSR